ncbi:MAG: SUMF1/EgtB/PvdO family nonheme iron enzyme [Saprospiraceae bacterium]|nr:SUMF1/EgtB/PvdO family nonheme iron enzyme [Saprospiraceae bacterium]
MPMQSLSEKGSQPKGDNRVNRGGSYFNNPRNCRCSYRNNNSPENRNNNLGFRLVLSPQLAGKPDGCHRTGSGPAPDALRRDEKAVSAAWAAV